MSLRRLATNPQAWAPQGLGEPRFHGTGPEDIASEALESGAERTPNENRSPPQVRVGCWCDTKR